MIPARTRRDPASCGTATGSGTATISYDPRGSAVLNALAAGEMVEVLTRTYNRARQAAITTEIIEISSGAEALKQAVRRHHDQKHAR